MRISSLIDTLVFSSTCWESAAPRTRSIVMSLKKKSPIIYIEPPVLGFTSFASLNESYPSEEIKVLTPHLPKNAKNDEKNIVVNELLARYLNEKNIEVYESWYLGTTAWDYSDELAPYSITLDLISEDELSHPLTSLSSILTSSLLLENEDYIHVGDAIDVDHFLQARLNLIRPDEFKTIPDPLIGCMGLQNLDIILELAQQRPNYHFILFQDNDLAYPEVENIHFIGKKNFYSLPLYFSPLKVAITIPDEDLIDEMLCAGKKIIQIGKTNSDLPFVHDCDTISEVLNALDHYVSSPDMDPLWLSEVDEYLKTKTWDQKIEQVFIRKNDIKQEGFNKKITPQII